MEGERSEYSAALDGPGTVAFVLWAGYHTAFMRFSRREFLKLAAQAGIAAPFVLQASGCAVLRHDTFDDETALSLGYVTGDTTSHGAVVWLRAQPGSAVWIEYAKDPALAASASTPPASVSAESDYTAHITLRVWNPGPFITTAPSSLGRSTGRLRASRPRRVPTMPHSSNSASAATRARAISHLQLWTRSARCNRIFSCIWATPFTPTAAEPRRALKSFGPSIAPTATMRRAVGCARRRPSMSCGTITR